MVMGRGDSEKVERQLSYFLNMGCEEEDDVVSEITEPVSPIEAFVEGSHEQGQESLRKGGKWEFLLRYRVSTLGICLGMSSQSVLWKSLAVSPSTHFLRVGPAVNLAVWSAAAATVAALSSVYLLKAAFFFETVRREFRHPVRVNFFFAPPVSLLLLALGTPPSLMRAPPPALWFVLMAPVLLLELKVYGRWIGSGGPSGLSRVANPSVHLSVIGNFAGALLGTSAGLKEGPLFFFSVGAAHYLVLLVTLYQRLPTNRPLPRDLHPLFFLFVAAPSVASLAWAGIHGSFGYGSRLPYFLAMFLYSSLVVRVNFFRGFGFSVAWWAYTVPMSTAAVATIRYSAEVTNGLTRALSVVLFVVEMVAVSSLVVTTAAHAFLFRDLFPPDTAIRASPDPSFSGSYFAPIST